MPQPQGTEPLRVLFLCTQNSARSQIAEALLQARGDPRIVVGSAGTNPGPRVQPGAVQVLAHRGIDWSQARPKSIDEIASERWDLIITVCDNARESCPTLPGHPSTAHWGVPDPAAVTGDEATVRRAYQNTAIVLGRRIDLLLALPFEQLERLAFERKVRAIGETEAHPLREVGSGSRSP